MCCVCVVYLYDSSRLVSPLYIPPDQPPSHSRLYPHHGILSVTKVTSGRLLEDAHTADQSQVVDTQQLSPNPSL